MPLRPSGTKRIRSMSRSSRALVSETAPKAIQVVPLSVENSQCPLPWTVPVTAIPVSVPSRLVRNRPDVRAAESNLHAASAQIGVAMAAAGARTGRAVAVGAGRFRVTGSMTPAVLRGLVSQFATEVPDVAVSLGVPTGTPPEAVALYVGVSDPSATELTSGVRGAQSWPHATASVKQEGSLSRGI